jgi:5-methylcytosine-specific restriction endonuclease McrA
MNKRRYNHGYEIYKEYSIKEIFQLLEEKDLIPDPIIYSKKDYQDSKTRIKIIKQLIERDGCKCQECSKKPTYFAMGKDNAGYWHLDLYSKVDNEHYMYTIDHIHPKSKGGKNHIDNYQLLCKVCNEDKSDTTTKTIKKSAKDESNTFNYINKKLMSLHQQTKGILNKIKNHQVVCIKKKRNFTIGNSYPILDIIIKIDKDFNSHYKFYTKDDNGKITLTNFSYFLTKKDSEYYIKGRYDNY